MGQLNIYTDMTYAIARYRLFATLLCLTPIVTAVAGLAIAPLFVLMLLSVLPDITGILRVQLRESWNRGRYNYKYLLIPILCLFSGVIGYAPLYSTTQWLKTVGIILGSWLLIIYVNHYSAEIKHRLMRNLCYSIGLALLLVSLVVWGHSYLMPYLNAQAQHLQLAYFNRSASILAIFAWLLIGYLLQMNYHRVASLMGLLILGLLLMLESEATTLAFGSAVIATAILYRYPALYRITAWGVGFTLLLLPICAPLFVELVNGLHLSCKHSWVHRLYIWANVITLASHHLVMGWGFATAGALAHLDLGTVECGVASMKLLPSHPHSGSLQMLLELGIVGLLLYAGFWVWIILKIGRSQLGHNTKSMLLGMCITYIIISTCSYNIWIAWWVITFPLGIMGLLQLESISPAAYKGRHK